MNKKIEFLILIDCQNDFIDGALGTKEAKKLSSRIRRKIKEGNYSHIVFTQDTHKSETYFNTREGRLLPILHCVDHTWGWEINKEIEETVSKIGYRLAKDKAANKATAVSLEWYLQKHDFGYGKWRSFVVKSVQGKETEDEEYKGGDLSFEVGGLCTDICVIANVCAIRQAFPEAEITVDASCCAGTMPQKHEAALDVMESLQVNVINRDKE